MTTGRLPDPGGAAAVTTAPVAAVPTPTGATGRMSAPAPLTAGRLPAPEPQEAVPTNPLQFVGGMLGNAVGDLKEMGVGITSLIRAAGHDIGQGVSHLIPGEQGNEYSDPSYLATIGRSMFGIGDQPSAILEDYKRRYGSVEGFFRGLYEDPLSFVGDALIVADGIGAVAKVGRVGALGKLPFTVVGDSAAQKILGSALVRTTEGGFDLTKYGSKPYAAWETGMAGTIPLKESKNFIVRGVQNQVYDRLLSISPEAAKALPELTERAAAVAQMADAQGLRVLRPTVQRIASNRVANNLLSTMRVNLKEVTQTELKDLHTNIITDSMDQGKVAEYAMGTAVPEIIPDMASPVTVTHDYRFAPLDAPPPQLMDDAAERMFPAELGYEYGKDVFGKDNPMEMAAPASPWAPSGRRNRLNLPVDSLDNADAAAMAQIERMGARPLGVLDMAADPENEWFGLHYFAEKDGQVFELNAVTPSMLDAQKGASLVGDKLIGIRARVADIETELADAQLQLEAEGIILGKNLPSLEEQVATIGGTARQQSAVLDLGQQSVLLAQELIDAKQELRAARMWQNGLFDFDRAAYHSAKAGVEIEPEFMAALRVRPWYQRNIMNHWMSTTGKGFADVLNRAFGPQRVQRFYEQMTEWSQDLNSIKATPIGDEARLGAAKMILKRDGVPEFLADAIVDRYTSFNVKNILMTARRELWDYFVEEGGRSGLVPEYAWETMAAKRMATGMPMPTYYPHFSIGRVSEFGFKGRPTNLTVGDPGMAKSWEGALFETGRVDMNARDMYQRAARIWIQHAETADYIDKVIGTFGKPVDAAVAEYNKKFGIPSGEVYIDRDWISSQLNLRGKMMSDTIDGIANGQNIVRATTDAAEALGDRLIEEGINRLAMNRQVYAIPESVAKKLQQEVRLQLGNKMKIFWDTPQQVWKTTVLSLSPRWVVNNFFGNTIFMGVENPGALRWALSQKSKTNERFIHYVLGDDVISRTEEGFFRYEAGLGEAGERIPGRAADVGRTVAGTRPVRAVQRFSDFVREQNTAVEEAARRSVLLSSIEKANINRFGKMFWSSRKLLEKIAKEGVGDAGQLQRAIESVDRTLGNMVRYSPVEQGIIRRFIMPFYGFYRHMAKVVALMPIEHPAKFRVLQLLEQVNEEMEKSLPDYLKGSGAIDVSWMFGQDTVFRLKNMNPLSAVYDDVPVVSMLNPMGKVAIERALRTNTLTGDDFDTPDNMIKDFNGDFWRKVYDGEGNVIDVERVAAPLPGLLKHVASQFGVVGSLPSFQLYPKSFLMSALSWAGASPSQPKTSFADINQFEDDAYQRALAQATGVSSAEQDSFGSFGNIGSFGEF